jgi:predicted DNA-binding ribbon-helix-helix protein
LIAPAPAFDRKALVEPAPRLDTGGEAKYSLSLRKSHCHRREAIMKSPVPKQTIAGRSTAISLEDEFWNCLREIANRCDKTLMHLITIIDKDRRRHGGNLPSAIRLFVLRDHQHKVGKTKAAHLALGRLVEIGRN